MKKANIVSALIGMIFSGTAFVLTFGFRQFPSVQIGPEFFPRILAIGLFICSFALFIQAIITSPPKQEKSPTLSPFDSNMRRLFIGAIIIFLYILSLQPVGFPITTPLTMFALMYLLNFRRYLVMVLVSLGTTVVVFSAFWIILNVDVPLGLLDNLF